MQHLLIPGLETRFQDEFSDELFYSGKTIREVILKRFRVVNGRLEGIAIFTNRAQDWFNDIPPSRLIAHIPDLKQADIKKYLLLADPKLYSRDGRTPPDAYQYFGISIADKNNSGLITTFDATPNGYKKFEQRQPGQLSRL